MSAPVWVRGLLRLHAPAFRARWGAELESTLERSLELERRRGGLAGRLSTVRAGWDLLRSALRSRTGRRSPGGGRRPDGSGGGVLADLRYALRSLARQPVFAWTVIATLAIGIGASTVVFSLVYGFLFRPLPYEGADRLVMVWSRNDARGWSRTDVPLVDAREWQARTEVFDGLAVIDRPTVNLTGVAEPERLHAYAVTHDLLDVLGVDPGAGRDFLAEDGRPGAAAVALLTDGFWRRRFGADPAVVGSVLQLNGVPHTVVGILPPSFRFMETQPDVLLALREDLANESREDHSNMAVARLADGVTLEVAQRAVRGAAAELAEAYPETNEGWGADVVPLRDDVLQPEGRAAATVLAGAIVFLLLMVCVNIANLLLARGASRRREMAVRTALGAGRPRLVRQLLTESGVLALTGGALGAALSFGGVRTIVASLPDQIPAVFEFAVDLPVLLFVLAVSLLATLAFGLLPALRDSRASSAALREEGRSGAGRHGRRFGSVLIVVQMALAMVLLIGGVTLSRSVVQMQRQDLGYDPHGLLTFRVSPPVADYADRAATQALHDALEARLAALPGVEAAGSIHSLPLRGANSGGTYRIPGDPNVDGWPARLNWISPGYADALRLPVRAGRAIQPEDREGTAGVVVVNELLARQRFDATDAVGRTLLYGDDEWTIVGVVADAIDRSVTRSPEPSLYFAAAQHGVRSRSYAMRTAGDPSALAAAVRRVLAEADPDLPPYELQTFERLLSDRLMPFRLIAGLMLGFALISLILSAVGLYGVTAYGVGRRTHEIGLRLAVGAERGGVVRMIVGEGMRRAVLGVGIGLALAIPLAGAMRAIAVGVDPTDPVTFAAVALSLVAVALLGTWLPARRAARLDPVRALTGE